jgi:transposase-like protein
MEEKKLQAIRDFIISSERSLKNAKNLLAEVLKEKNIVITDTELDTDGLTSYASDDSKVVE